LANQESSLDQEGSREAEPASGDGPSQPFRFLVYATEWASGHGGLSTFNREFCQHLAQLGDVTCYVPTAEPEEVEEARARRVELWQVGGRARNLGEGALLVPPRTSKRFDFVVGHGRTTGEYARAFVERHSPDSQVVQFLHVAPQAIEFHKDKSDASQVAEARKDQESELADLANFAFAVGPLLRAEYANVLRRKKKDVHEFRPGLFEVATADSPPPLAQCLILGRAEDLPLKGLDIAARALAGVNNDGKPCRLVVRGAPKNRGTALHDELKELAGPSTLEIAVFEYSSERDRVLKDIHEASIVLMPSRAEGFGLVALEAVSAAVPVLVSSRSGMAQLLRNVLPLDSDAEAAVVAVTAHLETDAAAWKNAVINALASQAEAFQRAARLRQKLAEHLSWEAAVQDFLEIVTRERPGGGRGTGPSQILPTDGSVLGTAAALSAGERVATALATVPEVSQDVASEIQQATSDIRELHLTRAVVRLEQLLTTGGQTLTPGQRRSALYARATVHLARGEGELAAELLEQARAADPESADGVASGALATLLRGDDEAAYALAQQAASIDPNCERALTVMADAAPESVPFDQLVARFGEAAATLSGPAAGLANAAMRRGLLQQAVTFARQADRLAPLPNAQRKLRLGGLLVQLSSTSVPPKQAEAREAVDVLREAVQIFDGGEEPVLTAEAFSMLALAHEQLGDRAAADEARNRAGALAPDEPGVVLRSAAILVQRERFTDALAMLDAVNLSGAEPQMLRAEARIGLGEVDQALTLLQDVDLAAVSLELLKHWVRIQMPILVSRRQWTEAKQRHQRALAADPQNVYLLVAGARLQRQAGDEGPDFLAQAMEAMSGASSEDLGFLLDELVRRGLWDPAGQVLKALGKVSADLTSMETRIWVAYNAGDLAAALELCRTRRAEEGVHPDWVGLEASILEEVGALPEAAGLLDEGLAVASGDEDLLLRRAAVALRQGDFARQVACLDLLPSHFDDLQHNQQYVFLLLSARRYLEAARAAYELRRERFSESAVHSAYAMTVLRLPEDLFGPPTVAGPGTAVQIVSPDQGDSWWILEDGTNPDVGHHELSAGSTLWRALDGRAVGDTVEVESLGKVEVREIASKYVRAFRESMGLFGSVLDDAAIRPVRVDGAQGFEPILAAVRARGERTSAIINLYDSNRLTIGACAALLGVSQLELVQSMLEDPARVVRCADGGPQSAARAGAVLGERPRLVCDASSLVILSRLEVGSAIVAAFDRLLIAQSLIDAIQSGLSGDWRSTRRSAMSLHYADGQYYRREDTEEEEEKKRGFWRKLRDFVGAYCEVAPCWRALSLSRKERQERGQTIDALTLDAVLLATEAGRVLLSDDMLLRGLANHEYGVEGVWTQVTLANAVQRNCLDERGYAAATVRLGLDGVTFVTISGRALYVAAEDEGWGPGDRFRRVCRLLSASNVDFSSAIATAGDFVNLLWTVETSEVSRTALLTALFQALSVGRRTTTVARQFERALRVKLRHAPGALSQTIKTLQAWRSVSVG
jgi:tetratricopeptide (TPR) repeat protein